MSRDQHRRRLDRIADQVTDAPPGDVADAATVIAYWDEWTDAYLHQHQPDEWPSAEYPGDIERVMAAEDRLRDAGILTFAGRPHPLLSDEAADALDELGVWYGNQLEST